MYTESQKRTYITNNRDIRNFLGYSEDYPLEKIPNDIIAYFRKSRKDEELYGGEAIEETLARHIKTIQEWAISMFNVPIPEENIKKEVVSGESIDGRPVMIEVLKMIENPKYRAIVCVDVQRLGRGDLEDQGRLLKTLQFSDTKVLTPNQWFDISNKFDKKFFEQKMRESKEYLDYIKEIMGNGRMRSVLDGSYPHSRPPYGFNRVPIEGAKGFTLEYNETEYKVCKLMVELLKNGLHIQYKIQQNDSLLSIVRTFGITKKDLIDNNNDVDFKVGNILNIDIESPGTTIISNYLNFLGIEPKVNSHWTPYMVRNILSSPAAHGFVTWGRRKTVTLLQNGNFLKKRPWNNLDAIIAKAKWNPIYTDEEKEIIKNYFDTNHQPIRKDKSIKNPLLGLVKCELCNSNMQRRPDNTPYTPKKLVRSYGIDKTKLRLFLREHKGHYSLHDIAYALHISKYIVDHWFATTDDKFTIPPADKWNELKELLNITTTEFDEGIMEFKSNDRKKPDYLICSLHGCNNIGSNLKLVEMKILESLQAILKDYRDYVDDYANKVIEETQTNELALEMINKKIEDQKQKFNRICDMLENGIYTKQLFLERKEKIDIEITNLEDKKKKLASNSTAKKLEKIQKMIPQIEQVLYNYSDDMTPERKNKLLSSIIEVIYYKKETGGRNHMEDFKLKIFLKI